MKARAKKARQQTAQETAEVRLVVVDDPGELIDGQRAYPEPGQKRQALQSLRDDPLGRLHCRGQIDESQYRAGRDMQRYYEHAEIGNVKAMDTTKEPVDGGGMTEVLTEGQQKAIRMVIALEKDLGMEGAALTRAVLAHRLFIDQVAEMRRVAGKHGREYLGRRFRECLETLAKQLRYA